MLSLLATTEVTRVGKFGLVGIFNTLLDFAIFNILSSKRIGFSKIKANICSVTVTMIVSFYLQRALVFGSGTTNPVQQAALFFLVTGFGLYVLQTIVIWAFTKAWDWPLRWVHAILKFLHLNKLMSDDFVLKNGAKVAATLVSLTWNYIMYKRIVFK
jgi:putative flippase GtrA